jgi:hypothetical protein
LAQRRNKKISQNIPNDKRIIRRYFAVSQTDGTFGITEAKKDLNGSAFDWGERMGIFMNRTEGHRSDITAL